MRRVRTGGLVAREVVWPPVCVWRHPPGRRFLAAAGLAAAASARRCRNNDPASYHRPVCRCSGLVSVRRVGIVAVAPLVIGYRTLAPTAGAARVNRRPRGALASDSDQHLCCKPTKRVVAVIQPRCCGAPAAVVASGTLPAGIRDRRSILCLCRCHLRNQLRHWPLW